MMFSPVCFNVIFTVWRRSRIGLCSCSGHANRSTPISVFAVQWLLPETGLWMAKCGRDCVAHGAWMRMAGLLCHANFFCYANFSIVFGPNFRGQKSLGGKSRGDGEVSGGWAPPLWKKPDGFLRVILEPKLKSFIVSTFPMLFLLLFLELYNKGPVKLIKRVKTAHSFLQSVSNQFHVIILSWPM